MRCRRPVGPRWRISSPGTTRTSLRSGGWWSMQRGTSTSTTRAISSPTVRTGYQPTVLLDRFSNTWFEGASLTSMGSTCDPVASSRTTSSTTLGRPWRGWSSVTMGPQRKGFVPIWSSMPPVERAGRRPRWRNTVTRRLLSTRYISTSPTAIPSSNDCPTTAACSSCRPHHRTPVVAQRYPSKAVGGW